MRCPNCATILADDSWLCCCCGTPVRPQHHVVRLDLWANPLHAVGWAVLIAVANLRMTLPSTPVSSGAAIYRGLDWQWPSATGVMGVRVCAILLALAGPWILELTWCWFSRTLRFSNDVRADFSGRGAQVFGWWLIWVLHKQEWHFQYPEDVLLDGALFFLAVWASLNIFRWFVAHVDFSSGLRLSFGGGYRDLLFWEILLALSVLTIIGWAWVLAAMYRWFAENTRGNGVGLRFHGEGPQILWRTVVAILFTIPVVTIPWAWLWYVRWLVQNVTMEGELSGAEFGREVVAELG